VRAFLFALTALLVALFAFTRLVAPPRQLDLINSLWPGEGGTAKVVDGAVFDQAKGLKLDVWRPEGTENKPRPVLVFFYGGGWAHGERGHYGFAAKALAARGFLVVVPDYRKVPDVRFPAFVEDAAAAMRWVQDNIAKHGGDPSLVAVAGHSAGGHIATLIALDPSYLQRAGVRPDFVKAGVGMAGPYDFLPFDSKRSIAAMRAWPRPLETQPVHYARSDAPPLLLMTGTEDDTVKPRNAIILSQRLTALGAPVEFRAYPGLGHEDLVMALSKPFRRKGPVLDDMAGFLESRLKRGGEGDADKRGRVSGPPDG
jgi:acetyl esterase/lipase